MHIVIGLLIAFVIVVIVTRQRGTTRDCRWRADRTGNRDGLHKYKCMACGAEVFTENGAAPKLCEKNKPV